MLMETADVGSPPTQVCKISSKQDIMIPLWIGSCGTGDPGQEHDSDEQLTKCAREVANLGNIRSDVKVDGIPVANLDVKMSMISGTLDYKINSLTNVTELYQKNGFELTVPSDTHKPNLHPEHFVQVLMGGGSFSSHYLLESTQSITMSESLQQVLLLHLVLILISQTSPINFK